MEYPYSIPMIISCTISIISIILLIAIRTSRIKEYNLSRIPVIKHFFCMEYKILDHSYKCELRDIVRLLLFCVIPVFNIIAVCGFIMGGIVYFVSNIVNIIVGD